MQVYNCGEYTIRRMARPIGFALYKGNEFIKSSTSLDYLQDIIHYHVNGMDEYVKTYLF